MKTNGKLQLVSVAFERSNVNSLLKAARRLGFTSLSRFVRYAANDCAARHPSAEILEDGKIEKGFTCVRCAPGTPLTMKRGIERKKRTAKK